MIRLIVRRLMVLPVVLLGVATVTFMLAYISPFDPISAYVGPEAPITPQMRTELERAWGLDQPPHVQYFTWLSHLVQGDFGVTRIVAGQPVAKVIGDRIGASLLLITASLVVVLVGGLILGCLAALYRDSWFDWAVRGLCYFDIAAPSFWVALLLIFVFSVQLGWVPAGGVSDLRAAESTGIDLRRMILPMLTLAVTQNAWFTMFVRNTLLEVLREDYVQYARAQGHGRLSILFKHALPNALIPFATLVGTHLTELIGGSVLVESIFGWPGLGRLTQQAGLSVDIPLLLAITLLTSILVVSGNLIADVLYRVLDPRVREALA